MKNLFTLNTERSFYSALKKYKWTNHERLKLSEHCKRLIQSGQCEQHTVYFLIDAKQGKQLQTLFRGAWSTV